MEPAQTSVERVWPPLRLSLCHDHLVLREATDEDIVALAEMVEDGIVEPGQEHFMPRLLLGRATTREARLAAFIQYHWNRRGTASPAKWDLSFSVIADGELVGTQGVHTESFPVLGEVHTGSYLARSAQGRGIGTRMRAMVLELCFGPFGARWASSGYVAGNERSRRISARLGYEPDGIEVLEAAGRAVESQRVRLSRNRWLRARPGWLDAMETTGVAEVCAFLGIPAQETSQETSQHAGRSG